MCNCGTRTVYTLRLFRDLFFFFAQAKSFKVTTGANLVSCATNLNRTKTTSCAKSSHLAPQRQVSLGCPSVHVAFVAAAECVGTVVYED